MLQPQGVPLDKLQQANLPKSIVNKSLDRTLPETDLSREALTTVTSALKPHHSFQRLLEFWSLLLGYSLLDVYTVSICGL